MILLGFAAGWRRSEVCSLAALFCINLLAVLWQARGLERLINAFGVAS